MSIKAQNRTEIQPSCDVELVSLPLAFCDSACTLPPRVNIVKLGLCAQKILKVMVWHPCTPIAALHTMTSIHNVANNCTTQLGGLRHSVKIDLQAIHTSLEHVILHK